MGAGDQGAFVSLFLWHVAPVQQVQEIVAVVWFFVKEQIVVFDEVVAVILGASGTHPAMQSAAHWFFVWSP